METGESARNSAGARLSPAASMGRLKLEETGGSLARAVVGDSSGVSEASSVAATGPAPLLPRNHRTISVLFAHPARGDLAAWVLGTTGARCVHLWLGHRRGGDIVHT